MVVAIGSHHSRSGFLPRVDLGASAAVGPRRGGGVDVSGDVQPARTRAATPRRTAATLESAAGSDRTRASVPAGAGMAFRLRRVTATFPPRAARALRTHAGVAARPRNTRRANDRIIGGTDHRQQSRVWRIPRLRSTEAATLVAAAGSPPGDRHRPRGSVAIRTQWIDPVSDDQKAKEARLIWRKPHSPLTLRDTRSSRIFT